MDRDLGGFPENGYVHYFDALTDLYGGDGVYTLTPLTLLNRFGRGLSLSIDPLPFSFSTLFIQDTSSTPESVLGGGLSYFVKPAFSLSASSLYTHYTDTNIGGVSNSLMGEIKDVKWGTTVIEYASSRGFFENSYRSYYLYSQATPFKNWWYAIQKIYAEPNFIGYYENTSQLYASVGFPVGDRLQGTLSYNKISYNLNQQINISTAPRTETAYGGLSYTFPSGLYTSLYYNYLSSKDALAPYHFSTQYMSLNGGKSFRQITLQALIEAGRYDEVVHVKQTFWQNYQVYTYYQPTPRQQYALYTRVGGSMLAERLEWSATYGFSTAWSLQNQLSLQLVYEYTAPKEKRQYASVLFTYFLPNKHSLHLQGYWNQSSQSNVGEALLTYSIPWGLAIGRKKSVGAIQGKAFYSQEGRSLPCPQLVVHCNGKKALTDAKGNFSFSSLIPGTYHIWSDAATNSLVSSRVAPIDVKGGAVSKTQLIFDHPGYIEGTLPLFEFFQDEVVEAGVLKHVSIILESAETQEKIFTSSDSFGRFHFDPLPPGRWLLSVLINQGSRYPASVELVVDLFPNETKELEIKILPIKRALRIIDSDF